MAARDCRLRDETDIETDVADELGSRLQNRDEETRQNVGSVRDDHRTRSGDGGTKLGGRPLDQCGIVVVIDYLNLLVRAFHAGTPTRIHAVKSMLFSCANIIQRLSPEYLVFALDGGHAERSRLHPGYKAHRPPKAPELEQQIELGLAAIEAIGWPMIRVVDWEADDVAASLATQLKTTAAATIVCSCDKDLLQLIGTARIYHPWGEGAHVTAGQVAEKYSVQPIQIGDYLALVGDTSDAVPGVKGIGPKKAAELLAAYGDLAGVLEAARVLRIPGAAGKALREQRDAALLSRNLVELRRDIPLCADWQDWPATSPRAGWVDELRRLELGGAVQRLSEIIPPVGRVRSGSPLIEMQWEHVTIDSFYIDTPATSGRDLPGSPLADARQPAGEKEEAHAIQADDRKELLGGVAKNNDDRRDQRRGVADVAGSVFQSAESERLENNSRAGYDVTHREQARVALEAAIATDFTRLDWINGFPDLCDLPPDGPPEIILRSIYASAARKETLVNVWRAGTDPHFVTDLALRGRPFEMPAASPGAVASVPAVVATSTSTKVKTLF